MPLELIPGRATLTGNILVNDTEALIAWLDANPDPVVDVSHCISMHMAVLQLLIRCRRRIRLTGTTEGWRRMLEPPHHFTADTAP